MTTKQLLNKYYKKNKKRKAKKKNKNKLSQNKLFENAKRKYLKYLQSEDWAQIKIDLYQTRGKVCEYCGSTKNIQVHHLTYKNIYKEEPEDLVLLCKDCHRKEHGIK